MEEVGLMPGSKEYSRGRTNVFVSGSFYCIFDARDNYIPMREGWDFIIWEESPPH
jgi:hypothetical protein